MIKNSRSSFEFPETSFSFQAEFVEGFKVNLACSIELIHITKPRRVLG